MNKKKLFLVVGRTSVGKTTITREVCKRLGLKQVKSYTTRPMRENEKTESDHIFIQPNEAMQYMNDMAAHTVINGYDYFVTKEILNKSDVYVIDPNGIDDLKSRCKDDYDYRIIHICSFMPQARERYEQRKGQEASFEERCTAEDKQFSSFEENMLWDYQIVNNGTLEDAVNGMSNIIKKELGI